MCDEGRYGYGWVDAASRLQAPERRDGAGGIVGWDEALGGVVAALRGVSPDEIGVLASPRMANEDLFALRRVLDRLGVRQVAFRVEPATPGSQDEFLIRADKNPNTRGAELCGLDGDAAAILAAARAGRIRCLWVFRHDLFASAWPAAEVRDALARVETLIFQGTNANATSALARYRLPAAAWAEAEGTFTNFEGRVQRFRRAVEPLGEALADWEVLGRVLRGLGADLAATRAEHWFRALAGAVPAFAGMTYASLGDAGQMIST
jgi:predicted molibdopterin-dependent oxidoreductase YjgC